MILDLFVWIIKAIIVAFLVAVGLRVAIKDYAKFISRLFDKMIDQ